MMNLLLCLVGFAALAHTAKVFTVPPATVNSPVQAVWQSAAGLAFDGPKLSGINLTSFDWWYFDAVSENGDSEVTVTFFNNDATALGFGQSIGTVNFVYVVAKFANGTIFERLVPATIATITTLGDGASGAWNGTGASFVGAPDLSSYVVTLQDSAGDTSGTLVLNSVAPAHFPAALNTPGQSEKLTDLVGWANAIPDANAVATFNLGGSVLAFKGYGYHDKNWGVSTLPKAVGSWYWGHARVGPYSVVFFDTLEKDNTEVVSGYIASGGHVIAIQGAAVRARPVGQNNTFPPVPGQGLPSGLHVEIDTKEGVFVLDLSGPIAWEPQLPDPNWGYTRWAGAVTGGWKGKAVLKGASVWEWIRYL